MLYDELCVAETPVIMNDHFNCCVQMFERGFGWRVNGDQVVATERTNDRSLWIIILRPALNGASQR